VRILPSGARALLVECASLQEALALHGLLWDADRPAGLLDAVPGARTVLLVADAADRLPSLTEAVRRAEAAGLGADPSAGRRPEGSGLPLVEVPVVYDGPDLESVAELTGLTPTEVVRAHTGRDWTVGFGGFAPGFAYLAGGDPRLHVPRRPEPRPRVPAGAVGLAGEFSGIYPRESPGGWQLLGRTDLVLWDLGSDPPALLRPGMRVRFVDATSSGVRADDRRQDTGQPHRDRAGSRSPRAAATCALEVVHPGPRSLIQDGGRPGLASMGVGRSGAADRGAFSLGARLLGQGEEHAAIECHGGGLVLRALGAVTMALTGASAGATVDGSPVGHAAPFLLPDGAELRLGGPAAGLRTYVSVRGGIDVEPVLGSRSHDTLSGIGPPPLTRGAVLPVGRPAGVPTVDVAPVPTPAHEDLVLALTPGPRADWVADRDELTRQAWEVDPASDRVGVRLAGPTVARARHLVGCELPSEGVVRGAVQVPADGRPVVFLADHPVTGGYPVVAVLSDHAVDALAQAVPGQRVRLRWA
jgi:KipI family sensor histidine kinase inhibitor